MIVNVNNGTNNKSKTSGIFLWSHFSSFAQIRPTKKGEELSSGIQPHDGKIPKYVAALEGSSATTHAFGSVGLTIIKPITIPRTGFPPNTRNADHEIKAGKKANAVSVKIVE